MSSPFVLHDELLRLQEDQSTYNIPNEVTIQGRTDPELTRYLNDITDRIEVSSDNITDPLVFDKIRSFIKNFQHVNPRIAAKLLDIILSAFKAEIRSTSEDMENNEKETFASHRQNLELYGFLVHWILMVAGNRSSSSSTSSTSTTSSSKSRKGKSRMDDDKGHDWSSQKLKAFDLVALLLEYRLSKIWPLAPERGTFISLFTKPAFQLFENPPAPKTNVTATAIKMRAFKILALSIKYYDQMFPAQTTIMQNLQYWEHSAEPMAELLTFMNDKYAVTQLADEILREISKKEFKDISNKEVKDSSNPKTFSAFLVKLSELSPKCVLKSLGLLTYQLGSESYTIRMAIVDILGNLIVELSTHSEDCSAQINDFFRYLEERMLDPISFVRSRVLQSYLKILDIKAKFPNRRYTLGVLALRHLEDKSSVVRKYAIRALTKLISTHPYSMYGGELDLEDWQRKLDKIKEEMSSVRTPDEIAAMTGISATAIQGQHQQQQQQQTTQQPSTQNEEQAEQPESSREQPENSNDNDVEMTEASQENTTSENQQQPAEATTSSEAASNESNQESTPQPNAEPTPQFTVISVEKMQQLTLMRTFHMDAVKFVKQIHVAIPIICQLLSSKSKPEVLEAMDFLVTAHNYKVKPAADGIKKMLHLIWTKDTSDEGKGIKMKLLDCYRTLYFEFDGRLSRRDNINTTARNLIHLTFNTTLAELTSLERLLCTVMAEDPLPEAVIDKLWSVYGFTRANIPKAQRRGAIIILGMLAKAKTEIVSEKVDLLLRIGLGPLGKDDLSLARYTCIALQRLAGTKQPEKGRSAYEGIRLPMQHAIFPRLKDIIESPTDSIEWFSVTEQAINTIYLLGEHPDVLCAEIIRNKTIKVFGERERSRTPASSTNDEPTSTTSEPMDIDYDLSASQQALPYPQSPIFQSSTELSQLVFLVGHVALKQIVHLEILEAAWKKKKGKKDENKPDTGGEDELDQVGGTAEDDIGDTITHIREREVLFGPNSLLARYGPLLTEICARNKIYTDRTLQMMATLALAKFMCVSSDYCEKHLQLLFTILERSKDATIRSNIVIALGDMAVCFNTLIDENISFLYNRLSDESTLVKKNAVMVLTHLILNGMVKVKGQISEMARCVEDPDQRIADLAKLFFTELATKDNAIYNNLPDILSNLTNCEPKVEEEKFRRIMRFIFSFDFAEKEKQAENVVDKLCQRFVNTDDQRIWRDIAFCLSLLPFKSEKSYRKLLENMPGYQDKLHEESVHRSFMEIIAKGRAQKMTKPELRSIIDELEQRVQKHSGPQKSDEDDNEEPVNNNTATTKKKRVLRTKRDNTSATSSNTKETAGKSGVPASKKTPARKRKRTIEESDEESDMELDDFGDDDDDDDDDNDDDDDIEEDMIEEEESHNVVEDNDEMSSAQ